MTTIAPILLNVFNLILKTGAVPDEWKLCFLTPIPKKGIASDVTNYKGIAQQSVIPKLFDKMLTEKLYADMAFAIPNQQHGFVPKRGTQTNLHELTEYTIEKLESGSIVDVVYFDFSKTINYLLSSCADYQYLLSCSAVL